MITAEKRDSAKNLYLELLKKIVTNVIYEDPSFTGSFTGPSGVNIDTGDYDPERRTRGQDWPMVAHTMVGIKRLNNVHECLNRIHVDNVPGDLIETGVWRGGVCIFMRGFLKAHDCDSRTVWVADSFEGLPEPNKQEPRYSNLDQIKLKSTIDGMNRVLGVSFETVKDNFRRYGLLDDKVRFLVGWFKDTLPTAPIEQLALLRLDGDMYESTTDSLDNLYHKLSPGGFIIIDDFALRGCRDAVHDFRRKHDIEDPIQIVDQTGIYWRKTK